MKKGKSKCALHRVWAFILKKNGHLITLRRGDQVIFHGLVAFEDDLKMFRKIISETIPPEDEYEIVEFIRKGARK